MAKDTRKEEKKPVEVKRPETIEITPKVVRYARTGRFTEHRKGGKNDRRK